MNAFQRFVNAFKTDITVIGGEDKKEKPKKNIRERIKEAGLAMFLIVVIVALAFAFQITHDKIKMYEQAEYLVENDPKYVGNYLECYDRNVGLVSQKNEPDTNVLAEELMGICKMEVNAYRGFLVETMGSLAFYGWSFIKNDMKAQAEDTILHMRRSPKIKIGI